MSGRIGCLITLGLLFATGSIAATENMSLRAESRLTSVTVYPDRAMPTRIASLTLRPGSHQVSFEGLPAILADDSVRVEGSGTAQAKLAGIEVKTAFLEQVPQERVRELEKEARALADQIGAVEARQAALAAQKAFLESIRVGYGERISKELAAARPTTADLGEMSRFLGNSLLDIANQHRGLETEKKTLAAKLDAVNRQIAQIKGEGRRETKTVTVAVEVTREGTVNLALSYLVSEAGWEPTYEARLGSDGKSAELTYKALVRQKTGEEWEEAEVSLSTARPAVGGNPPELSPWVISFPRYEPLPAAAPAPYLSRQMAAESLYDTAAKAEAFAPEESRVEEQRTSVTFRLPRKLTVPSDGYPHGAVIAVESFPALPEYLCVPKLSPAVYLQAKVTNTASYPLLAGKAGIFLDGNFTGNVFLDEVAAGEEFDLSFGPDPGIKVEREETKQHDEAGFLGKNRQTYRYRIEVASYKKQPQTVTILDQLPVAADEEIKVSLGESSPKPEVDAATGALKWPLALQPQEKKELVFEFQVEYPKDREVVGL